MSQRDRQSGAARSPHRGVLADALRALSDPTDEPTRPLRVRDAPRARDQDWGARDRTYRAHSRSVADELPGGSTVPRPRAWPDAVRPLSHGAACPYEPPTRQINPQCVAQRVDANRSRRTDRWRACASPAGQKREAWCMIQARTDLEDESISRSREAAARGSARLYPARGLVYLLRRHR